MSPERKVKIIIDSTFRVPQKLVEKYDIGVAQFDVIQKDGKSPISMKDSLDANIPEFVKKLEDKRIDTTTSAPSPGTLVKLFELSKDRPTIFMHMSGKLSSATPNSANIAKEFGYENVKIVDTQNVCLIKRQAIQAAILADKGASIDEIVADFNYSKERSVLLVLLDKLNHLKKSGRANNVQEVLLALTGKKLILEVRNNKVERLELAQGINKGIEMMSEVAMSLEPKAISIFHGGDEEFEQMAINATKNMALKTSGKIDVDCDYAGPLLTAHTGSRVIAFGIFSKDPIPEKLIFEKSK